MRTRLRLACLLIIAGALVSACGGSSSPSSPTSPSVSQTVGTPGGAAVSGPSQPTGAGAPADASGTTTTPTPVPPTVPQGMTVAMGAVSGVTGTCPALSLTIDGKAVVTDDKTTFDGGTCEGLKTATQAAAGGVRQTNGSILAQRVRVGAVTAPPTPPGQARVQGLMSEVSGSCLTSLILKIDGKAVKFDANTKFEQGSCADVKNGVRGGAMGRLVDGVIVAERAIVSRSPTTPGPAPGPTPGPMPGPAMTIIQGAVGSVGGSCPSALTFTLDGRPVQTDTNTRFDGGTCADVKAGIRAAAGGKLQANGVILAVGVKIGGMPTNPNPMPPTTPPLIGFLKNLGGTCPAIKFTVDIKAVETNDKTFFDGKPCKDLANDMQVGVVGAVPAGSTTIVAQRVMSRK